MAATDCIGAMKLAMKARRDMIALAAEALSKMFDKGEEELVSQVCLLPEQLLTLVPVIYSLLCILQTL